MTSTSLAVYGGLPFDETALRIHCFK